MTVGELHSVLSSFLLLQPKTQTYIAGYIAGAFSTLLSIFKRGQGK